LNRYRIKPRSLGEHLFEVSLRVERPDPEGQRLYLPAWIRGSYMVRDFARNLISLSASAGGARVAVTKLDKQTWRVAPVAGPLEVIYTVYAWDLSVRAAHLDTTHAFFNGPSVFLGVAGCEGQSCEVEILPPEDAGYRDWRLAVAMQPLEVDAAGFGRYRADDYEALLDYPAEMGAFDTAAFEVHEVPHRFVVSGRHKGDLTRVCRDLRAICREAVALFGALPVDTYLFLLRVVGEGYGGLEHRNSSSLMIGRDSLPHAGLEQPDKDYRRLLGLCSHEYFHLWHVKRITPEVFQRRGTEGEVYTRQLWVFEGITSYYDDLILVRSGVIEPKAYFEMLAETITRVMRGSGRFKQTLEESSFDAWTKFYKQDENAPNAIVSYYAKGALLALLLDLSIRERSGDTKSLDDVMRALWQHHGEGGIGVPEGGFEALARQVTNLDLEDIFASGARSTEELPLAEALHGLGIELLLRPTQSPTDLGDVAEKPPEPAPAKPVLGARWSQKGNVLLLEQVFDGGAAQRAGLAPGDEVIAVDGVRVDGPRIESALARTPAGEAVMLHLFRRDELMSFEVRPQPAPADTCTLYLPEAITDQQRRRRQDWLKGYAESD